MNRKEVFVIVGPTAVGKTQAAISLARQFGTEIISADSRQCYRELNIGVARPSPLQLDAVPHHFIASHSIHLPLTAAGYERQALEKSAELFALHDRLVVTGGTGLYLQAFLEGLDEMPAIPPSIREEIMRDYETGGLEWLQEEIKNADPGFFAEGEIQNPQRMMRALEVVRGTGRSILDYRGKPKKGRSFTVRKYGLYLSKDELMRNIRARTSDMLGDGLLEEVRGLMPFRHLGPLQTVGYTEMFEHLDGKFSLEKAAERVITHTWQYAKRQLTWFRRDPAIQWVSPHEWEEMLPGME